MKKTVSRGDDIYSSDVFQILYEYEVSRSKRYPSPLTLLKIEMTPSALNDELLGSASMVFTSALNSHLRSVDIPSKTGNVYSVLLPTSDEHGARAVCERLLSVFKNKFDVSNGAIAFSIQIGSVTHNGGPTMSGEGILQKAAEALKQSKLKGPNTYIMLS
jgi:hypothetical protein